MGSSEDFSFYRNKEEYIYYIASVPLIHSHWVSSYVFGCRISMLVGPSLFY